MIPMCTLIEYSDNYSKTSRSLWQYYRDEPSNKIVNFKSFEYKIKITGIATNNDNKENVEITVSLKYLSNFWRTLECH